MIAVSKVASRTCKEPACASSNSNSSASRTIPYLTILAQRMIDTCFAADSGINLGEQRRRNLDQRHTAMIARGHKASQVANNAASHSNDWLLPLGLMLHEPVKNLLEIWE